MRILLRRLVADDRAQDLVEYALLAAFVALASIAALDPLRTALRTAYLNWNAASQSCWQMPAPGSGGGC
jgi:Flp pilus assembly pilin Flp